MRRVFSTLFVSLLLCLVFLIGVKSNVYAYTACAPKDIADNYYCDIDPQNPTRPNCPKATDPTYDPDAANYCCGVVTGSSCDSYCFLPGTLIKSATGAKKIEDIRVGDKITSFENDKITESKVAQIFERKRDYYFSLIAGDYSVKASAEHPFYIGDNQYKKIEELKKGDTVYVLKDRKLFQKTVTSNTKIVESTPVYNMTVDNTHTYFA